VDLAVSDLRWRRNVNRGGDRSGPLLGELVAFCAASLTLVTRMPSWVLVTQWRWLLGAPDPPGVAPILAITSPHPSSVARASSTITASPSCTSPWGAPEVGQETISLPVNASEPRSRSWPPMAPMDLCPYDLHDGSRGRLVSAAPTQRVVEPECRQATSGPTSRAD